MSLSKIKKLMSVVTIRRGHFVNSVFVNLGIYSCAVDAFLEISTHLFLSYVSNLRIRNEFTDLLFNVFTLSKAGATIVNTFCGVIPLRY